MLCVCVQSECSYFVIIAPQCVLVQLTVFIECVSVHRVSIIGMDSIRFLKHVHVLNIRLVHLYVYVGERASCHGKIKNCHIGEGFEQ